MVNSNIADDCKQLHSERENKENVNKPISMTTTKPNVRRDGRYSITETAHALGVHRNTIRRYAQKGQMKCGVRRATSRIFFSGQEILNFWLARL